MGGKRYEEQPKLNMKKVAGVIVGIAVIIMFVITLTKLLNDSSNSKKITESSLQYFPVYTQDKWGVIDSKGNVVVAPTYEEMILIPNNSTPIFLCTYDVDYTNNTYKTKAINEKGLEILKGYDSIEAVANQKANGEMWYENNVFKVSKNGKYGMIDGKGKELLKCDYDSIEALAGVKDCIIAKKDEKVGLYDNYGNTVVTMEYSEIKPLGEDNKKEFIVKNADGKYGIVSAEKKVVLEPIYAEIASINGKDLYVVKESDKWAIINADKSVNITDKFDEVKEINDENIIIKVGAKYGIMNKEGEIKVEAKYDDLNYAFDKNYIAKTNDKYGVIDSEGNVKLDAVYSNLTYRKVADNFVGDKEELESDLINDNFEVKLTGVLSEVNTEKGYMRVRVNAEYKYYNFKFEEKKNTEVLPKNTIFLDKKDGKYGYINNKGEVIVDYQYDDATEQNDYGYASVNKDGKWGCLDKEGKVVVEPTKDLKNNQIINFIDKWHLGVDANANYYTDL